MATVSADLSSAARRIAREVAAPHADDVDRQARFPHEAVEAMREEGLLGAMIPESLGGGGTSLAEIGKVCFELARGCSSSAMVFAMHQLQVATLVRHYPAGSWFESYLQSVATEQRLIASVTSEVGTGGNMGQSVAAVTPAGVDRFSFEKQAPTVSYGDHCDDLLTTLRRGPDADPGDQVWVLHRRAETEMTPTGVWDTLGMRGTCSPGFTVRATVPGEQILGADIGPVMAETAVPVAHILWSHAWLGIATEAVERGHAFVRASARRAPGQPVAAAERLAAVLVDLRMLRSEVSTAVADFERWDAGDRSRLNSMAATLRFNSLKLAASESSAAICGATLQAIGIMAFKNDSPFSIGRLLRDAMSGRLMIANDRLLAGNAASLAIVKEI